MSQLIVEHPEVAGNLWVGRAQNEKKLGLEAEMDADFIRAEAALGVAAPDPELLREAEVAVKWRLEATLGDCAKAFRAAPKSTRSLITQVILYTRGGRLGDAKGALAIAEATIRDASDLNSFCYSLAVENIELDRALTACQAAVKLQPGRGPILDSLGFALLRHGRNAEALDAYNRALLANPTEYSSLYGRGLVEARLNRSADSARDLKDALAARPSIKASFNEIGVRDC